jgi:hypothetical protein
MGGGVADYHHGWRGWECIALTVEPRHKNDAVDTHLPLLAKHDLGFPPECRRIGLCFAGLARLDELLGLGEEAADETNGDGNTSGNPKYRLPTVDTATDAQVCARGTHVAKGVPLLQDTRHETSGICWAVLESHGDSVTVSILC